MPQPDPTRTGLSLVADAMNLLDVAGRLAGDRWGDDHTRDAIAASVGIIRNCLAAQPATADVSRDAHPAGSNLATALDGQVQVMHTHLDDVAAIADIIAARKARA